MGTVRNSPSAIAPNSLRADLCLVMDVTSCLKVNARSPVPEQHAEHDRRAVCGRIQRCDELERPPSTATARSMSSWVLNTETDRRRRFSLATTVPAIFAGLQGLAGRRGVLEAERDDRRLGAARRERHVAERRQLRLQAIGELPRVRANLVDAERAARSRCRPTRPRRGATAMPPVSYIAAPGSGSHVSSARLKFVTCRCP